MSTYEEGDQTARGWKGKKYYLSDEAIALLVAHCKGTPLTMSAYLDQLIKKELDAPAERFLRGEEQARKVLNEGQRQLEELTKATGVPREHLGEQEAEPYEGERQQMTSMADFNRRNKATLQVPASADAPQRHPMDFADEPTRRAREAALREEFDKIKKQPTKKDFDLDV